jgi:hypothetical protein
MAVTKSGQNNLTSPDGNGLALFVDINDGGLKMKDINGNIENVSTYVFNRPLDAGVLMMDNGLALSSTLALVQDQDNNNSQLYLSTNQVSAGKDLAHTGFGLTNTAFGVNALLGVTTGDYNTAFGYQALQINNDGYNNTAIGFQALQVSQDGSANNNVAIGYQALNTAFSNANDTIAIGSGALFGNNRAEYSVAIGTNVGNSASLYYSQAIGKNTLTNVVNADTVIAIGNDIAFTENGVSTVATSVLLGNSILGGSDYQAYIEQNVLIGQEVGYFAYSLTGNIGIGYHSMYNLLEGLNNVAIGYEAMHGYGEITTPQPPALNVAVGYQAMYNTLGDILDNGDYDNYNVAIGYQALYGVEGVSKYAAIAIGYQAAKSPIVQDYNIVGSPIAIGDNAGTFAPRGTIFIGTQAGQNSTGTRNIGVGAYALKDATGTYNTAFGAEALRSSTTANNNTAVGYAALYSLTTSLDNTAVGQSALAYVTTGAGLNVGIGSNVAQGLITGTKNVYVGANATASDVSDSNVVIGASAIGTGSNNTLVGQGASTGGFSGSIILGKGATATGNNQFVVGSTGTPVGTLATEAVVSDRSWSVIINGTAYKVLLKA